MQLNYQLRVAHSGRTVPEFNRSSLFIRSVDTQRITSNSSNTSVSIKFVKSAFSRRWGRGGYASNGARLYLGALRASVFKFPSESRGKLSLHLGKHRGTEFTEDSGLTEGLHLVGLNR